MNMPNKPFNSFINIIAELELSLDDVLSINNSNATAVTALNNFGHSNKHLLKMLFSEARPGVTAYGKYIIQVARHEKDTKIYIVNNVSGYISEGSFNIQSVKPFSNSTQHGLNYIELTANNRQHRGAFKIRAILIRYSESRNVKMRDSELGNFPLSYGNGSQHIADVFNIMQDKVYDTDSRNFNIITEQDLSPDDPDKLIANIVRASVYMLTTQLQTHNQSDSIFLNPSSFRDDQQAIHRRINAFYASNPSDDNIVFVNFRNQLTFKDRLNNYSVTSCNNIGACFAVDNEESGMERIDKLKYIGVHASIGHAIDI